MELITSGWDPDEAEPFTDPRYDESPEIRTVDAAPVHPRRVTHAVLVSDDVERLATFYKTVGGLEEVGAATMSCTCVPDSRSTHTTSPSPPDTTEAATDTTTSRSSSRASTKWSAPKKRLVDRGTAPEQSIDNDTKRSFFCETPTACCPSTTLVALPTSPTPAPSPPLSERFSSSGVLEAR